MKKFLLIAGDNYYPSMGTGNWIYTFASYEEAKQQVSEIEPYRNRIRYRIGNREYDWFEIVNLDDWINC
jgi:hypothetical protein